MNAKAKALANVVSALEHHIKTRTVVVRVVVDKDGTEVGRITRGGFSCTRNSQKGANDQ